MPTFDCRFTVQAPLKEVSDFHRDTRALKRLTPPPAFVQLHDVQPLSEGSVSRFTIWAGPLPLRWTAVHRGVSESGFTDVQTAGPARRWEHTHTFRALSESETEIHEHIEYEHHPGLRGLLTRMLFSPLNLRAMFAYRRMVTRGELCRTSARQTQGDRVS
jgi:ligand-binding SRPBCC domain-containing protein